MNRRTKRKIAIVVVLVLLLALLGAWYWNFAKTKSLRIMIAPTTADAVPAPTYLFSFSGDGDQKLYQPIGIAIAGDKVFVTDAVLNTILVFDTSGRFVTLFKQAKIGRILYVTVNPVNGNLYVTDRGEKQVHIFSQGGAYLGVFDPKLPKSARPSGVNAGKKWDPTIVAFAPDGSMYVIEVLKGHRVLQFDSKGAFVKSVGTSGFVKAAQDAPGVFQFPNGLVVHNGLVYVADSNNRRVQVFDLNLGFKSIINTAGLPRGIDFFKRTGIFSAGKEKFVISDTLAHDGTIWTAEGQQVVIFGGQGSLAGQFNYPNQLSVDSKNQIFMTDTQNSRIQVWGWPALVVPAPPAALRNYAWLCLVPLLLLPLLLLRRKRKFMATRDFVLEIVDRELADTMPHKRRQWFVMPEDYVVLKDIKQGDVDMAELLEPAEYSESDARVLKAQFDVSDETAAILAVAQRMYLFCTEDLDLRTMATSTGAEVANVDEYLERFTPKRSKTE